MSFILPVEHVWYFEFKLNSELLATQTAVWKVGFGHL